MKDSPFSIEPFLGIWELDPAQSQYELGTLPQRGQYQLLRDPSTNSGHPSTSSGQVAVVMDWTDAADKDFHMIYYMTPDGIDHPYTDSPAIDAIQTTLVAARTLETISKKDGNVVARGVRELADDGKMMRVTQGGKTPDGTAFNNIAIYLKRGE